MVGGASLLQALGEPGGVAWPARHRGSTAPWAEAEVPDGLPALSDAADQARAALERLGEADADTLHRETDVPVSDLLGGLLELELRGLVVRLNCGRLTLR